MGVIQGRDQIYFDPHISKMHHLSRVGSRLGEGLTSGLNRIASTTQELAMHIMDPSVSAISEISASQAVMPAVVNVDEAPSEFKLVSESIIKAVEDEIEELKREKMEYQEILKNLKEAQRKQIEMFGKASSPSPSTIAF
jgi:alanyl-tRNA synthetase